MFKPYRQHMGKTVAIDFEGVRLEVPATMTVAAAVLGYTGKTHTRRAPVSGENRSPYCFMGVCHECLMEIDGVPNQQACITEVRDGMRIRRQIDLPKCGE